MDKRSAFDNGLSQSNVKTCTKQGAKTLARAAKYLLVALPLLSSSVAFAASETWDGSSNTNWSDGTNWVSGSAPALADDVAVFTGSGGGLPNLPITDLSVTIGSLDFSGVTDATFTLTNDVGFTLTLNNGITAGGFNSTINNDGTMSVLGDFGDFLTVNNTGTLNFTGATDMGSNSTINNSGSMSFNTSAGDVTFAADITGAGTLTKLNRDGDLILTGDTTFSHVQIATNGGHLIVGDGANSGSLVSDVNTGVGTAFLVFDRDDTVTFNNVIDGFGGLIQEGGNNETGRLILTANQEFFGLTTVDHGVLQLGNGGGTGLVRGPIANNGEVEFNFGVPVTFIHRIAGTGDVVVTGGSTVTWDADHIYTGHTTVDAGTTLSIGAGGGSGSIRSAVTNNGSLIFNRSNPVTYSETIDGIGTVTKEGAGLLALTGMNSYSGLTTINNGTLQISGVGANLTNSNIHNDATLYFVPGLTTIYTGDIDGTGQFFKAGGRLVLTGNVTHTGGTTLISGDLQIGDPTINGGTTGTISGDIENGGRLYFNRSDDITYSGVLFGNGSLYQDGSGILTLSGENELNGTLTINNGTVVIGTGAQGSYNNGHIVNNSLLIFNRSAGNDLTYNYNVTGLGRMEKQGTGELKILGIVTNNQGVDVVGGTLRIGQGGSTGEVRTNIRLANDSDVIFNRSEQFFYNDVVSGTGNLTQEGPGLLVLTSDNNYDGTTTVRNSGLQIGNNTTNGSVSGDITLDGGEVAFYRFGDYTFEHDITGTGNLRTRSAANLILTGETNIDGSIFVDNGVLQVGNGGTDGSIVGDVDVNLLGGNRYIRFNRSDEVTFAGILRGEGGVQQYGSGTLILNGVNENTGTNTVNAGTLLVGGTDSNSDAYLPGNVTVGVSGTLGGHGTIGGNVTNSGMVNPGASHGTLTILGAYAQAGSGTLNIDIHGAESDVLNVSGLVTLNGNLQITVDPTEGFVPGQIYNVITSNVGVAGSFNNVDGLGQFDQNFLTAQVLFDTDNNQVSIAPALNETAIAAADLGRNQRALVNYLLQNNNNFGFLGMIGSATTASELGAMLGESSGATYANQELQLAQTSSWFESQLADRMDLYPQCNDMSKNANCMRHPSLWILPYGSSSSISSSDHTSGLDTSMGGAAVGVDFPVATSARLGAAVAATYFNSDATGNENASDDGTLYQFGIYGNYHANRWNLSASVAVSGTDNIDTTRTIDDFSASSSYSATIFSQQVRASYDVPVKSGHFRPFVGLVNQNVSRDDFSENTVDAASDFALSVGDEDFNSLKSQVGASLEFPMKSVVFLASAAWQHEFSDTQGEVTGSYVDSSSGTPTATSYTVYGIDIGRESALVKAGFILVNKEKVKLSALYEGRFADSYSENGGKLQLDFNLS